MSKNAGARAFLLAASMASAVYAHGVGAQELDTRIGKIAMEGKLPAHESIAKLYAELDFQQATQSYLWALPLVLSLIHI